jgi:hypothetical protein
MREQIFFDRLRVGKRDDQGVFLVDSQWKYASLYCMGRYSVGYNKDMGRLVFVKWRPQEGPQCNSNPHLSRNCTLVSKKMERILRAILLPEIDPDEFRGEED